MAMPTGWTTLAKQLMQTGFTQYLITDVDPADESIVTEVVIGKSRKNPTAKNVVEIHENDPDEISDTWPHAAVTVNRNDENPMYRDVIGRSRAVWMRRFTIKIIVHLRGKTQIEADEIKSAIVHRIENWILDNPNFGGLKDDGNEEAIMTWINRENSTASGDDRTPIWRTKLWIEVKTMRKR